MATTPVTSHEPGTGVVGTASTVQGEGVAARSKDPAWKYCTCPDITKKNSLKCIFCDHVSTNGTTRVKLHLACFPSSGVIKCPKVPADVREEIRQYLKKKRNKKAAKIAEQKRARSGVNLSHSKLTTMEREQKRNRACEYICQWFYEACIPFNAVTLPSFNLMLQSIGQYGEDMEGPSAYEMDSMARTSKKRVEESFKAHRKTWELSGCTIMTDAWTDIRGRGVMNLVIHSAYGVVFFDSVDCSAVKKDGEYIFELVDRCIEKVGEAHVVQVVTDNASVNQAAARLLEAKRPNIFWNGCAAHCTDLMLEDIGKLPSVDSTITKARSVTVFLYAHTRVLSLMREFLGKDLVRSGITRFATAYLNLKSMLDTKKELQKLFRSDQMDEMGYLKKVKGSAANKIVRSESFWRGVDTAVKFFEPLANLLRRMDSDVPAMGFIHGAFLDAKQEISAKFENGESGVQEVLDIVDKRWDIKLKGPLHRAGYFLNPYYYYENKVDIELDGSFRDGLVACVAKMVRDRCKVDAIMEHEIKAYADEVESFGKESAKRQRRNKSFDPANWWSNHGTSAPNLRVLAMRILSLTCSSSACERNFSVFQQVHTKRRNRLLHDKMRDLVFIKANSKLEQKRGMKDRDPLEDKTYADVVEDENNEWITGIVPEAVQIVAEPEGVDVEESTSQGSASKQKKVSCISDSPQSLREFIRSAKFYTLPAWIKRDPSHLSHLSILRVFVRDVRQEDLEIIARLPALRRLSLRQEDPDIQRQLVVSDYGFRCLTSFELFTEFLGHIVFQPGALPKAQEVRFSIGLWDAKEPEAGNGGFDLGLGNLRSLQEVLVAAIRWGEDTEQAEDALEIALKHAFCAHPNHPSHQLITVRNMKGLMMALPATIRNYGRMSERWSMAGGDL